MTSLPLMNNLRLEAVVESNFRSEGLAIQIESIGAIETMVVASESEAEGSGESFSSGPEDTGTEGHCPASGVDQTEITSQVHEQGEFLTNGTTNITNVGLEAQTVSGNSLAQKVLVLDEVVIGAKGNGPFVVDVVTNFRSDGELGVVVKNSGTYTAADPSLGIS